jgi:hypothetical protein
VSGLGLQPLQLVHQEEVAGGVQAQFQTGGDDVPLEVPDEDSATNLNQVAGDHFCAGCGTPAPWLSRSQLMQ